MRIGIDIDDTLTSTYEYVMPIVKEYIEKELNKKYEYHESESEWYRFFTTYGLTHEQEFYCWNNFFKIKEYEPRELAVELVNKLYDANNEIIFMTSRNNDGVFLEDGENAKTETEKWLEQHNIKYNKLITESYDKGEIAEKENIDIFIDDSINHCKSVASKGIKTYLMTRPFNKKYECKEFERVESWKDFYNKLNNL